MIKSKTFCKNLFLMFLLLTLTSNFTIAKVEDFIRINNPVIEESLKNNLFLKAISEPEDGLTYELYLDLDTQENNIRGVFRCGDEQPLYYEMDKMLEKRELSLCHKFFDTMFLGIDKNFSKDEGGIIYLKYLYNFFSLRNKFRIHKFSLKKINNKWQLFSINSKGKKVKKVVLKSKKQMGKVVGVSHIEEKLIKD